MRGAIRCVLFGVLAAAACRHLGHGAHAAAAARAGATVWIGALGFALAAVIDPDRTR